MKVLFAWPNKESFYHKPIALPLLSAIARRLGWQTRLFDTTDIDFGLTDYTKSGQEAKIFKPVDTEKYGLVKNKVNLREKFLKVLEDYKPDLLALSVLSGEFLIAVEISGIFREVSPDIPIIWGGKSPTINPEYILEMGYADFVCIGEGLEAFPDFLEAISHNGDPYVIPNIWGRRGAGLIRNSLRPLKKSLDDLPYLDWEIFDKRFFCKPFDGKMYVGGDHMLNWGCPYHCTYCINDRYHRLYDNNYFMRSYGIDRIIPELKYLKDKYRLELIKFHDEDFLLRPLGEIKELSAAYRKEVDLPFAIETNPKSVTPDKVALLKEMNCVSVGVAIETGDPKLRNKLLRRVDSELEVVRAFTLLNEAGIRNTSFNMLGIPFETRETYRKTITLNRKAGVQYPNMAFFYPFEGTELRRISIEKRLFDPKNEKSEYGNFYEPHLHFDNLTEEELIGMRNVFVLYVKLPQYYEKYIERSERSDIVGAALRGKLLEIYEKTVWQNDGNFIDDGFKDRYIRELEMIMERHNPCPAKNEVSR